MLSSQPQHKATLAHSHNLSNDHLLLLLLLLRRLYASEQNRGNLDLHELANPPLPRGRLALLLQLVDLLRRQIEGRFIGVGGASSEGGELALGSGLLGGLQHQRVDLGLRGECGLTVSAASNSGATASGSNGSNSSNGSSFICSSGFSITSVFSITSSGFSVASSGFSTTSVFSTSSGFTTTSSGFSSSFTATSSGFSTTSSDFTSGFTSSSFTTTGFSGFSSFEAMTADTFYASLSPTART